MVSGKDLHQHILTWPTERPLQGLRRNLLYGIIIGIVLQICDFILHWTIAPLTIVAWMTVGWSLAFAGWGVERLWYSILAPMLKQPLAWNVLPTKIPFWYIAGGAAFVLPLLFAEKWGWMDVQDVPVKNLFYLGGLVGVLIQFPLHWKAISTIRKSMMEKKA